MVLAASAGADSAAGRAVSAPAPGGPRGAAGPAAEHDTRHAVAALLAALGREDLAVLAPIDALDLPDIGLDADGVELLDRAAHELRALLAVPRLLAAAHGLGLMRLPPPHAVAP